MVSTTKIFWSLISIRFRQDSHSSRHCGQWPVLNKQLATLMIVDRPDLNGDGTPDRNFIRYPGALLADTSKTSGYTVGIPLVTTRTTDGTETIRWVKVVEEMNQRT